MCGLAQAAERVDGPQRGVDSAQHRRQRGLSLGPVRGALPGGRVGGDQAGGDPADPVMGRVGVLGRPGGRGDVGAARGDLPANGVAERVVQHLAERGAVGGEHLKRLVHVIRQQEPRDRGHLLAGVGLVDTGQRRVRRGRRGVHQVEAPARRGGEPGPQPLDARRAVSQALRDRDRLDGQVQQPAERVDQPGRGQADPPGLQQPGQTGGQRPAGAVGQRVDVGVDQAAVVVQAQ